MFQYLITSAENFPVNGGQLGMDGTGVTSFSADGGGTVNCQFGAGPWETFTLRSDGANVYIESVA